MDNIKVQKRIVHIKIKKEREHERRNCKDKRKFNQRN